VKHAIREDATLQALGDASRRAILEFLKRTYSGAMAGMIKKSIPDLQPAFDEFAACLQREAEKP
jgi:DNA-binding transcriptional ArsR family regulator